MPALFQNLGISQNQCSIAYPRDRRHAGRTKVKETAAQKNQVEKSKHCPYLFLLFFLVFSPFSMLSAADSKSTPPSEKMQIEPSVVALEEGPGYTINFNNVPIIEYIKFISKIANLNCIYNENEMNFNVTIVSEEPTSLVNVMSALVQILKINGFNILEQENNLIITKSGKVSQIATVVSQESPLEGRVPPIITRVFRIKNANPSIVGNILTPLLSEDAILEVSAASRHIIITDIIQNIQEVEKLLLSIDVGKSPLAIESYITRNNPPETLINLAHQIISPLSEGNPIVFVPQNQTNTIFMVSTPYLIEKSMMILEDLDTPPSLPRQMKGPITGKNILIYHIKNNPADVLQDAIKQLQNNLAAMGPPSQDLVQTLSTMRYIRQTHALVLIGSQNSLGEVQSILQDLDLPFSSSELEFIKGGFFVYQIKHGNEEQITRSLGKLVDNLKKTPFPDNDLIETIESMKWIKENNSFIFTGNQHSIDRLKEVLPYFDVPAHTGKTTAKLPLNNDFYVYTPKNLSGEDLLEQVKDITSSLKGGHLADPAFLHTLSSVEWIRSTHSLVFTGDPQSIDRVHALLNTIDQIKGPQKEKETFYIYPIKFVEPGYIEQGLKKIAKSLPKNSGIGQTIDNLKYIAQTHSLIFKGPPSIIDQIKPILETLDTKINSEEESSHQIQYFVYKLQNAPGSFVIQQLDQTAKTLKGSDAHEKELTDAINTISWNKETNSLVITGTSPSIDKLKLMIAKYDISRPEEPESTEFYVFRPKTMNPPDYLKHIQNVAKELGSSGLSDAELIQSLEGARLVPDQSALMFTGTAQSISKIRDLAPTFDASKDGRATRLYIYKPLSMNADKFQKNMILTANDLEKSGLHDRPLIDAFNSARVSSDGISVFFAGTPDAIAKLETMVSNIDQENEAQQANKIFLFTPKNRSPEDLIKAVTQAANEMSNMPNPSRALIHALKTGKIVGYDKSVLFTGTPDAISRLEEIIPTFDSTKASTTEFYVYKPKLISADEMQNRSVKVAQKLSDAGLNDPELLRSLKSARLTPSGESVTYVGTPDAINRLQELISTYDSGMPPEKATEFLVYQPKNMSADEFLKRMVDAGETFENSRLSDPDLIKTLKSAQITSGGEAVLFTGTPSTIQRIKELTGKYDFHQEDPQKATEFFVYKPKNISADELRRYIRLFADNMKSSGLADPALIHTLNNAKLAPNGKSVLFTGTLAAIEGVKELLPSIDQVKEDELKTVGKTTFLVYKIQHVPGHVLMGYLRDMAIDLERAGSTDSGLIKTLQNIRYVKETNSIIFTGTAEDLKHAQSLATKFDIPELSTEHPIQNPSGYLIYQPKYVPGEQLILILKDFKQNLSSSGINDPPLFNTIGNLKWMQPVSSILISGDDEDTKQVYSLLERFDLPLPGIAGETGIESISDMSFLIYKLQYHSGSEIQSALQKIGQDLARFKNDKVNKGLVDAIQATQWIEVTNSLISTGESGSLAKLKELVKSIDVPLKQVFVEILIIETTISNSLNFGLRWGSQGVYREKFAYGTGSFPQNPASGNSDPLAAFGTNLGEITSTNKPTGTMIPFTSGFDLGVIGDIILHKGKSYFALGSIIDALKADSDSTVALNQKVITQDNKNATIFVGQNIPFTGSVVTNTSNNTVQNANLEYRDVGVKLSITPQIGDNDTVTLNINQEFSEDITSTTNTNANNPNGLNGITTSKTATQTSVTVPNKSFLIISGQIDNSLTKTRTSIPCLGGLPLIGAAFSQNDSLNNKACVIVFVRPHIINSFDVYKEITTHEEDLHRAQTEDVETFDAGLELIKTPDDY